MKENILEIKQEYLSNIDLTDEFFNSLREDYFEFDEWFKRKQKAGKKAYVTFNFENKISAFLMLKFEDEKEDYSSLDYSFKPNKRIKVSTFKVIDTGKKIGEKFIEIIINEATCQKVTEIYFTTFK